MRGTNKHLLSAINVSRALLRLISATVFNFAHPPVLSALLQILSLQIPRTSLSTVGSRAFSVFGPSTWNDLPLPLRQKPSLDCNLKHSFSQNYRPESATFSDPCCCLHPSQFSVCCPFLICVNLALYSQNARVCECLCVCMRLQQSLWTRFYALQIL